MAHLLTSGIGQLVTGHMVSPPGCPCSLVCPLPSAGAYGVFTDLVKVLGHVQTGLVIHDEIPPKYKKVFHYGLFSLRAAYANQYKSRLPTIVGPVYMPFRVGSVSSVYLSLACGEDVIWYSDGLIPSPIPIPFQDARKKLFSDFLAPPYPVTVHCPPYLAAQLSRYVRPAIIDKWDEGLREIAVRCSLPVIPSEIDIVFIGQYFSSSHGISSAMEVLLTVRCLDYLFKKGYRKIWYKPHPRDSEEKIELLRLVLPAVWMNDSLAAYPLELLMSNRADLALAGFCSTSLLCGKSDVFMFRSEMLPQSVRLQIEELRELYSFVSVVSL